MFINSRKLITDMTKFRVIVEKDEDGIFIAECTTLPGCVSQGKSKNEAIENLKDAIKGYISSLQKHNESLPSVISDEVIEVNV